MLSQNTHMQVAVIGQTTEQKYTSWEIHPLAHDSDQKLLCVTWDGGTVWPTPDTPCRRWTQSPWDPQTAWTQTPQSAGSPCWLLACQTPAAKHNGNKSRNCPKRKKAYLILQTHPLHSAISKEIFLRRKKIPLKINLEINTIKENDTTTVWRRGTLKHRHC